MPAPAAAATPGTTPSAPAGAPAAVTGGNSRAGEPRAPLAALPGALLRPQATPFGDGLRIDFAFQARTAAAAFARDGMVTLVFDSAEPMDASALVASSNGLIAAAELSRQGSAAGSPTVLRLVPAGLGQARRRRPA
jgi:hypothetical protein